MNAEVKEFGCTEVTFDVEIDGVTIRVWVGTPELFRDAEAYKHLCRQTLKSIREICEESQASPDGTPPELIRQLCAKIKNVNAVQVKLRRSNTLGGYEQSGMMAYKGTFADDDATRKWE